MRLLQQPTNRRKPPSYPVEPVTPPKSPLLISIHNQEINPDEMDITSADSASSRPQSSSGAGRRQKSKPCYVRKPNLKEILANEGSPPWTLEAFQSYSEQNHCAENLEFLMDATRYKDAYRAINLAHSEPDAQNTKKRLSISRLTNAESEQLQDMWNRLIEQYIAPSSPRELNVPGNIRNDLMSVDQSKVTPPEYLQPAVNKIYELIEDSILFTFLNDVRPPDEDSDSTDTPRSSRDRFQNSKNRGQSEPTSEPSVTFSPTMRPDRSGPSQFSPSSRPNSHLSSKTSQSSNPGDEIGSLRSQALRGAHKANSPSASSPTILGSGSSSQHLQTPPHSPGPGDDLQRQGARRKTEPPWKRMSVRFGFKKRAGQSLRDLPEGEN